MIPYSNHNVVKVWLKMLPQMYGEVTVEPMRRLECSLPELRENLKYPLSFITDTESYLDL